MISHGLKFREPQHINWKRNFKIIMDAVEDYARRWIQREVDQDPELESLSDWVRTIRSLVQGRIHKLKKCVNSRPKSVFKDQEAAKCLPSLHDKYVSVPVDKASNNIVFVCKSYYFECLIKELGINSNTSSNTTYKPYKGKCLVKVNWIKSGIIFINDILDEYGQISEYKIISKLRNKQNWISELNILKKAIPKLWK